MSTNNIKPNILGFIEYLRSTDRYKVVCEQFKEYLKTADPERFHYIIFDFDEMDYEFGEIYSIADRTDNIVTLAYGNLLEDNNGMEIEPKEYD